MNTIHHNVTGRAAANDARRGDRKYLMTGAVCERYGGISERTVARWVKSGRLPQPMIVNGRLYFAESSLDAAAAAAQTAAQKAPAA